MPLSSTANYSCDVVKEGGNDNSHAGPFQTIQAAINYLMNNFTLDADHKAVVNLAPGIYADGDDVISIVSNEAQYIDFVGAGKEATIIQSATTIPVGVSGSDARNHFINLTIQYTGPVAGGDFAVSIVNSQDVRFENCLIKSTRRCIDNFSQNSKMHNCEITSTCTDSVVLCTGLFGLIRDSIFHAEQLGAGSALIDGLYGQLFNCRLSTLSTLPTPVDVRGINDITGNVVTGGGRLTYCTIESEGFAFIKIRLGSVVEYCYFSGNGTGSVPVIDRFEDCLIRGCFFHQKSTNANLRVVDRGAAFTEGTKVVDTTFYAPNLNGNVIGSLEQNNSRWENCRMISADNATGYSLGSTLLDKIAVVKNLVANRPIDPLIRLTDNGLAGKSIAEAKGYSQKRWWALQGLVGAVQSVGLSVNMTIPPGGTALPGIDAGGPYQLIQTGANNTTARIANTTPLVIQPYFHPKFYLKFRLDGTGIGPYPGARLWCGFFTNQPPTGSENLMGVPGAGLVVSDTTIGALYYGITSDGTTTNPTVLPLLPAGIDTNPHTFTMFIDGNNQVIFQMDGMDLRQCTTFLPPLNQGLAFYLQITRTNPTNTRGFVLYDAWCEFDA